MSAIDTTIVLATAIAAAFASHTALSAFAAPATSPEGYWRTIDDETSRAKSIVEITETDGELQGKVVKLLDREGKDPNPTCDECPGDRKGQPIKGMTVLWGLEQDGEEWTDGTILDPNSGDTYDATVKLEEEGEKLNVRGYIGLSMLGRTQIWERVDKPAATTGNE